MTKKLKYQAQSGLAKRVFVALSAGSSLHAMVELYRREHGRLAVRWVPRENLHVTLVAPWMCDDTVPVCHALAEECRNARPFELRFTSVGPGPAGHHPRLIWATGPVPGELRQLQGRLQKRFGGSSLAEGKDFLMHMTVARFRAAGRGANIGERRVSAGEICSSVSLMESRLCASGALYREVCRVRLGG
ncbi:2'-5' RNA ligase family protein [Prosthecochloris sp. N3]|uniref:2'-5' RNA ligase family protein n=1 Tax=Prosthecochloris ethylica TaxID=2743976 RepID=A0ABR9XRZ8_9CHLB|nr:2'-5' RNA ligase family protein [Prosthecochloris ethylica]MBF0586746.1 2'-5' RNA ligase family protein [Prosthecochloris ethylica]MBF0636652.1 2'-5' RNA ligase family protein [Prosthecochloris ethylica]NUK47949.1 2'-5' RNA ligase family protein [Prosthecochloris ethylica]